MGTLEADLSEAEQRLGKSGYTAGFEARLSSETHQKHNLQHVGRWVEHGTEAKLPDPRMESGRSKEWSRGAQGTGEQPEGFALVVNGEWELLNQPTWSGQFLRIGPENYSKLHFLKALYHLLSTYTNRVINACSSRARTFIMHS